MDKDWAIRSGRADFVVRGIDLHIGTGAGGLDSRGFVPVTLDLPEIKTRDASTVLRIMRSA